MALLVQNNNSKPPYSLVHLQPPIISPFSTNISNTLLTLGNVALLLGQLTFSPFEILISTLQRLISKKSTHSFSLPSSPNLNRRVSDASSLGLSSTKTLPNNPKSAARIPCPAGWPCREMPYQEVRQVTMLPINGVVYSSPHYPLAYVYRTSGCYISILLL